MHFFEKHNCFPFELQNNFSDSISRYSCFNHKLIIIIFLRKTRLLVFSCCFSSRKTKSSKLAITTIDKLIAFVCLLQLALYKSIG